MKFKLQSKFKPLGDQPQAITKLVAGLKKGYRDQTLLGVTGSGKTFTMANIIAKVQKPTLVISHNKTLAAQLASEFREFFPENEVHYFVSYYDYYQPEAYIPHTDTYIEKETEVNDEIDRLRHASTQALLTRNDVIIMASVSCIYGLGSPDQYESEGIEVKVGQKIKREEFLRQLTRIRYERNDYDLRRGVFRIKGDVIELFPIFSGDTAFRLELFGQKIEAIREVDSLTGKVAGNLKELLILPASHYLPPRNRLDEILKEIRDDLEKEAARFKKLGQLVEAQRLEQRVNYDLEMIKNVGYCNSIENYSRYFERRKPGTPPYTLLDYFPDDYLLFIDESHITVPQIGAMSEGDKARKNTLVRYGFRLKAAIDNRPLRFDEFIKRTNQTIYTSATPADYEKQKSKQIVEQLIRPTGLLDPKIEVKPTKNQIDDLINEIQKRVEKKQRTLVTTLTKRMSEELADYLKEMGIKVHYLHSEIDTFQRLEILRDLRLGVHDVVVGINLLREGLDLPEVSLIVILDADKEGYLRSETALVQTMGRAARHAEGQVIMYADRVTRSMKAAITETERRRKTQESYNKKHKITPKTIEKAIKEERLAGAKRVEEEVPEIDIDLIPKEDKTRLIKELEQQMKLAAQNLEFEKAAKLRDQIKELKR